MKNTINQPDVTDINRALHPTMAEDIFSPSAHGTFFRIDHMLGIKQASIYSK